ncbi:helix-turn-helix domain-containing protein [Nocardioides zeae]|uniref:Helix-turn-helix domain-containing protein n=1 Tax=Nocardioides imazamoxiresistens TaxID=3231893 RepID=A0ABU3Q0K1_9ACTN|nr:helix-turn-helix domain-containing protein [Nocardioides zeae]MDT9594999.1 helix-turn-helix domain-containing protein [Nocardioides zeae]
MPAPTRDGRTAVRHQHRRAIVDAAHRLVAQHGPAGFTVEQVAATAGVARRTVFNHFATLAALRLAVGEDVLGHVVEDFLATVERTAPGAGATPDALDAVASAAREVDLAPAVATLAGLFGVEPPHAGPDRPVVPSPVPQETFERVGAQVLERVLAVAPATDPLAAELFVTTLTNGLAVVARHWLQDTDGALDVAGRQAWDDLLERLLTQAREGYRAPRTPPETLPDAHPETPHRSPEKRNPR